jgi:hypothetical protein
VRKKSELWRENHTCRVFQINEAQHCAKLIKFVFRSKWGLHANRERICGFNRFVTKAQNFSFFLFHNSHVMLQLNEHKNIRCGECERIWAKENWKIYSKWNFNPQQCLIHSLPVTIDKLRESYTYSQCLNNNEKKAYSGWNFNATSIMWWNLKSNSSFITSVSSRAICDADENEGLLNITATTWIWRHIEILR